MKVHGIITYYVVKFFWRLTIIKTWKWKERKNIHREYDDWNVCHRVYVCTFYANYSLNFIDWWNLLSSTRKAWWQNCSAPPNDNRSVNFFRFIMIGRVRTTFNFSLPTYCLYYRICPSWRSHSCHLLINFSRRTVKRNSTLDAVICMQQIHLQKRSLRWLIRLCANLLLMSPCTRVCRAYVTKRRLPNGSHNILTYLLH